MKTLKPFEGVDDKAMDVPEPTTSLQLSDERRAWLEAYIMRRLSEVTDEMGIEMSGDLRTSIKSSNWMTIRLENQMSYDNDFQWRQKFGGVFSDKGGFSLNTNKRYTRLMKAKACDDILGTRPFFTVLPIDSDEDEDRVAAVERRVQRAVENSNVCASLREVIKLALVRNECVAKISYVRRSTRYVGPARVMVDADGNPMVTPELGLYIHYNDDFVPDPEMPEMLRLKKDPSFAMLDPAISREQYEFRDFPALQQELRQYDGPDVRPIDYRDFWCPLRVASVHEADICAHVYDETPEALRAQYGDVDVSGRYFELYDTGATDAIEAHGENADILGSRVVEKARVAEVYVRVDADEDGVEEELFCLMDLSRRTMIYGEYLANLMEKRPFEVVVGIEKVPNRWYGVGVYSMMAHSELYIDTQFNRYNDKDSTTASATFIHDGVVPEWDSAQPVLGGPEVYRIKQSEGERFNAANPPIFRVNLMEMNEMGRDLMRTMQQAGDLQFGVISAEDASISGLNASKTATGNMIIERTSNTLTRENESEIVGDKNTGGIEAVLDQVVTVTLENMNAVELELGKDGKHLVLLNREEIRDMSRNVKLLLTRMKSAESIRTSQQARQLCMEFLDLRGDDPERARRLRPLYIRELKALQVDDADDLCPEVSQEDVAAHQERMMAMEAQQMQAQQQEQKPISKSLSVKFGELKRSEQVQVLQSEGIAPASDEEVAAARAAAVEEKQMERMVN